MVSQFPFNKYKNYACCGNCRFKFVFSLFHCVENCWKLSSLFRRHLRAVRRMWNRALKVGYKCCMFDLYITIQLYNFYFVCIYIVILNMNSGNFFLLLTQQLLNRRSVSLEQLNNFNLDQNILGHLVRKVGVKMHFATLTRTLLLIRSWGILL